MDQNSNRILAYSFRIRLLTGCTPMCNDQGQGPRKNGPARVQPLSIDALLAATPESDLCMHCKVILHARSSAETPVIASGIGQASLKCPVSRVFPSTSYHVSTSHQY
eukprot:6185032-Pleurochrysis_carterae.AAC.2